MSLSPDNSMLSIEGRYVDEVLWQEHSFTVASRENHVVCRTEEFNSISHGGLHVHFDEHVGAVAQAGDSSSHSVGRRDKVNMGAAIPRMVPGSLWASSNETASKDGLDGIGRGAVGTDGRPPASQVQLCHRDLVVDLDLV